MVSLPALTINIIDKTVKNHQGYIFNLLTPQTNLEICRIWHYLTLKVERRDTATRSGRELDKLFCS